MTYSVIYSDPPWRYRDRTPRGGAEHHYRTLSLRELAEFRVNGRAIEEIAAPDCALFLWGTWPMLTEALYVIKRWGFEYKTAGFLWVKTTAAGGDAVGLGHHTRSNSEPCFLATRGRPKRIDASVRQVVFAPRLEHSAKPPEVRDRIVQLYGDVPRIELFARERVAGWDAIGDEL